MPQLGLELYAGIASQVVLADVIESSVVEFGGRLVTEYRLGVVDTYVGEHASEIVVQVAGGEAEGRSHIVEAAPRLQAGARKLFFLAGELPGNKTGILGLKHGTYEVLPSEGGVLVQGLHAPEPMALSDFVGKTIDARIRFELQREAIR